MAEDPEMVRVLEIPAAANFEELHFAILDAMDFDATQLSSFFICNHDWEKKVELTLINMDIDEVDMVPIMKDIKLKDYEHEVGQKLIFEYDFVLMWRFFLEVAKLYNSDEPVTNFPKIVESIGAAPKQYDTLDKYPEEITDEDNLFIHELEAKNLDLFHHDDDYDEGDEHGDETWDPNSMLDDLGLENEHHDEDLY
jgi:hypothetical protein